MQYTYSTNVNPKSFLPNTRRERRYLSFSLSSFFLFFSCLSRLACSYTESGLNEVPVGGVLCVLSLLLFRCCICVNSIEGVAGVATYSLGLIMGLSLSAITGDDWSLANSSGDSLRTTDFVSSYFLSSSFRSIGITLLVPCFYSGWLLSLFAPVVSTQSLRVLLALLLLWGVRDSNSLSID